MRQSCEPSLTHGSIPLLPSFAKNTNLFPTVWKIWGVLAAEPGEMFFSMAGVPQASARVAGSVVEPARSTESASR